MMRAKLSAVCAAALLLSLAAVAGAQRAGADGRYQVAFEEVVDTCSGAGRTLTKATVEVRSGDQGLRLTVPGLPTMTGKIKRGTKFKVDAREGGIKLSATGRAEGGELQFVLIVEHYEGDKPVCTQSWNASGPRR
jgi:hypothetical protein